MSSYLPQLNQTSKSQIIQQEFRGYNHNDYTDDNEFYDEKNMTCNSYPYASPRLLRGEFLDKNSNAFGTYTYKNGSKVKCNGIASKQGFCFVEGNRFYYKSNDDNIYHDIGEVDDGEKQFVSLGAYILIFPDKKYFNSVMYLHYDDEEWLEAHGLEKSAYFGSLEADKTFAGLGVRLNMCNVYGEDYEFDYIQENMPDIDEDKVTNGAMWLDISSSPAKMMQYSEIYSGWLEITSNYIKITVNSDITTDFKNWDGITLSGFPDSLADFNSASVLYITGKNDDGTSYFVVPGILKPQTVIADNIIYDASENNKSNSIYYYYTLYHKTITQTDENGKKKVTNSYYSDAEYQNCVYSYTEEEPEFGESVSEETTEETLTKPSVSMQRKVPDMDYIAELDNRLWGCSNENHEIYASKPGDPFNFNYFLGGASDSYVLTVGSDGDFTGCIAHLGYMLFFKENIIHKIYGTKPSNFQLTSVAVRGVEKGSSKSLCIVNETLFYKSETGIMMYQGSLPECISDELGNERYFNAVAGACSNKYYISMQDAVGEWHLFSYDTAFGLWHKEDNTRFIFTLTLPDNLYYIDGNYCMKSILNSNDSFTVKRLVSPGDLQGGSAEYEEIEYHIIPEKQFEWFMETGDLYSGSIDSKYISKLRLMLAVSKNTHIDIYIKYDNEQWKWICSKSYRYTGTNRDTHNIPIMTRRSKRMKIKITGSGACLIQAIAMSVEQGSEL
nr:MAG TPA: stabilization protein [Caudoviricetes sp.]